MKKRIYFCGICSREYDESEYDPCSDRCPRCRRQHEEWQDREQDSER